MKPLFDDRASQLICPTHPRVWFTITSNSQRDLDSADFCDCCTMDCTPFCKDCDQWELQDD